MHFDKTLKRGTAGGKKMVINPLKMLTSDEQT